MINRISNDQDGVEPEFGWDLQREAASDTRDKSLLVITPDFPDEKNRYIGSLYVKDLVDNLRQFFKEITVICPVLFSFGIIANDRFCHDYRYDNVSVYFPRCFFVPRIIPVLDNRWKLGLDLRPRAVRKCIEKNHITFDLIHAQFTWPSAYCAALLKEQYHVPYVITPHEDPGWLQEEIDLHDARMERAWSDANCIMYMNSLEIPKLKIFNKSTISVPNGYHPRYHPQDTLACRQSLKLDHDAKILFTFGILQKRKGLEYLVEAMAIISRSRNDVYCYIGGGAQYEKSYETFLKTKVKELHMEDRIHFLGFMKTLDIPVWLNACDLFVLPSLEEGFGIAQIEALACGKPVIAAKNSGSMDIITDPDVGILCEKADAKDFSRGVLEGLGKNWDVEIILTHAQRYSWGTVCKELVDVYRKVLQELK